MKYVKVEYVGRSDKNIQLYNGKRYCFSKQDKITLVPIEVYNYLIHNDVNLVRDLSLLDIVHEPEKKIVSTDTEEESQDFDGVGDEVEIRKRGRPKKQ